MICLETHYFSLNKVFLRAVGLWPYQQSNLIRFQFIFMLGILITAIIFQLTTFISSKCTPNFIIKILSSVLFSNIVLTAYVSFYIHIEAIKNLLIQLQNGCNKLKEGNEIAIIEKYGYNARRYTIALTTFALFCTCVIIIGQFWSNILDLFLRNNESRPRHLYVTMEYFLDQEKFFYFIQLHLNAAILIIITILLAIGTTSIAYIQCIYALFKIASCRIKHAMKYVKLRDINFKNDMNEDFIIIGIIRAVDIHRQAMRLCDRLIYIFEGTFFIAIVIAVVCLSLNLFRIASSDDIEEIIISILNTTICLMCMFIANYIGQDITDRSNIIYATAYNIQWYNAPTNIQKLILFLLQRSNKNFTLTIGGIFEASIECFATMAKTSISYFTVIYSTR